ncbi:hypothetical protein PTKIN_Ptkin08bG0112400 [Pterospermum kingtungense]
MWHVVYAKSRIGSLLVYQQRSHYKMERKSEGVLPDSRLRLQLFPTIILWITYHKALMVLLGVILVMAIFVLKGAKVMIWKNHVEEHHDLSMPYYQWSGDASGSPRVVFPEEVHDEGLRE